jgi:hypothetical protein
MAQPIIIRLSLATVVFESCQTVSRPVSSLIARQMRCTRFFEGTVDRYNIVKVNEADLREAAAKMNRRNQEKGYVSATLQPEPVPVAKAPTPTKLDFPAVYDNEPGWRNWQTHRT